MTDRYQLHLGDCLTVMRGMADCSVDAVVTDPPYGLGFMGKSWDKAVPGPEFFEAMLRVAKPGAHIVAFGGTRLFHRMTCAIEDAGWEIRDCLMWLHGQGFPKSLDVSKAIDKAAGAEREVLSTYRAAVQSGATGGLNSSKADANGVTYAQVTAPATDAAKQWQGWGTALKPAWEPIILARKPLVGTVAANVLAHGTGALNVDGCRIEGGENTSRPCGVHGWQKDTGGFTQSGKMVTESHALGRWPANLILSGDAPAMVDAQVGDNVSRFMYCPKADSTDRNEGLEGMEAVQVDESRDPDAPGGNNPRNRGAGERTNFHPTVKSTDLMRWLVRLVTPPGGVVLDPFGGTFSTGKAAMLEGCRFIGIEQDPAYFKIGEARMKHAARQKILF